MTICTKHFTKVHIKVFKNFRIHSLSEGDQAETDIVSDTKMALKNNLSEISSSSQRHIF